jgi:hypothetical protein
VVLLHDAMVSDSRAVLLILWAAEDPVGRRIAIGSAGGSSATWRRIVGVVADTHSVSLSAAPEPMVYVPAAQVDPIAALRHE